MLYKLNILQYTFEHTIALSNYEILPSLRPTHTEQIFSIKIQKFFGQLANGYFIKTSKCLPLGSVRPPLRSSS